MIKINSFTRPETSSDSVGNISVLPYHRGKVRDSTDTESRDYGNKFYHTGPNPPMKIDPDSLAEMRRQSIYRPNIIEPVFSQAYTSYVNVDSRQRNRLPINVYDEELHCLPPYPIHFVNGSSLVTIDMPNHHFHVNDQIALNNVISKNVVLKNVLAVKKNSLFVRITHQHHGLSLYGIYNPTNPNDFLPIEYVDHLPTSFHPADDLPDHTIQYYILKINSELDYTIQLSNVLGSNFFRTEIGNIPTNFLNRRQIVYLLFSKNGTEYVPDPNCYLVMLEQKSSINYQDGTSFIENPDGTATIANNTIYIKFFNLYGVPLGHLNSGTPVNEYRTYAYLVVLSATDHTFTVDVNRKAIIDPSTTYSFYNYTDTIDQDFDAHSLVRSDRGGGSQCYVRKIKHIMSGFPNPNHYVFQLDKVYKNVVQARIIGSTFPNSQRIVNDNEADTINNRLYWRNLDDGNWIYTLAITPGNYSPHQLAHTLEEAFNRTIRYQYTEEFCAGIIPPIIDFVTPVSEEYIGINPYHYDPQGNYKHHLVEVSISEETDIVSFSSFRRILLQDIPMGVVPITANQIVASPIVLPSSVSLTPVNRPVCSGSCLVPTKPLTIGEKISESEKILAVVTDSKFIDATINSRTIPAIPIRILVVPDVLIEFTAAENFRIDFGSTGTLVVPQMVVPFSPDIGEVLYIYFTQNSHMRIPGTFPNAYRNLYRFVRPVLPSTDHTNGSNIFLVQLEPVRILLTNFFRNRGVYPHVETIQEINSVNTAKRLIDFVFNPSNNTVLMPNHQFPVGTLIITDQFTDISKPNQIFVYEIIQIASYESFIVKRYNHGQQYKFIYDSIMINFSTEIDTTYWLDQITASMPLGLPPYPVSPLNQNTLSFTNIVLPTENRNILWVTHPNHGLQAGNRITIAHSVPVNQVPSHTINRSHRINRILDNDRYEILLEVYTPLFAPIIDQTNTITITYPSQFQMFFNRQDTLGHLLSFDRVGEDVAVTPYRHTVRNIDCYAFDYSLETFGSEYCQRLRKLDMTGPSYFYISCPELGVYHNTKPVPHVFGKIRWFDDPGKVVFDSFVPTTSVFYEPISVLSELHLTMYQPDGRLVEFNGLDHSFTVEIVEVYNQPDETDISERINSEVLVRRI